MTLGTGAATAVIGAVAVLVAGWGAWYSSASSRQGPTWARQHLERLRLAPWLLGLTGIGVVLAVEPLWVGLAVVYMAVVAGVLMWQVRRRLVAVELAYGPYDDDLPSQPRQVATYLLGGGIVLAVVGVADLAVRGWSGVFALVLAAILAGAGLAVRRR